MNGKEMARATDFAVNGKEKIRAKYRVGDLSLTEFGAELTSLLNDP